MKLNPVRYIWLRIWGDRSVIAAVIRFPTAPRQVWCSPRWQKPDAKLWHRFFFCCIFAFCLVELLPSRLVFSFVIPPHLSSEISFISFSIFFFFSFFLILSARSVGVSEEAREQRSGERQRTRAALCHPFVFASQRPARRLDYHVRAALWRSAASLSAACQTLFPFFSFPPHCGQSWGKIFSRRGKGSSVLWSRVCVCTTVHTLLWEEPPPTCAAFQHLFINFTPL